MRCLVRPGRKGLGWLTGLPVETVEADLFHRPSLVNALNGTEFLVHIAGVTRGKRRRDFYRGNVETTLNLLNAAEQYGSIKQFCFLSSLTATGPSRNGTPVAEETPCRPITPYGHSKLEAEQACRQFQHRVPVVIVRPPAVYGPRDRDILHMFRWIKFGIMPLMGPREKTLSLIYVSDLARALVRVLTSPMATGKTYFAADRSVYKYSDLVSFAASLMGKTTRSVFLPKALMYSVAAATQTVSWILPKPSVVNIDKVRDLITPHWVCSAEKIKRELGFQTTLYAEEGLSLTLEWYRVQGWL